MNKKLYYKYWGKASKEDGSYHLLPYHCLDVAAVGKALLLRLPDFRKKLSKLAGMNEKEFVNWMVYVLALHDLGKFTDSFQNLRPDILNSLQQRTSNTNEGVRHDTLGYYVWLYKLLPYFEKIGIIGQQTGRWAAPDNNQSLDLWMKASTGHHGEPAEKFDKTIDDFLNVPNDIDAVIQFSSDFYKIIFSSNSTFPDIDAEQSKIASWWIAGFVVLCDWLGSSRSSEEYISIDHKLKDYWQDVQSWAESVVNNSGLIASEVSESFSLKDFFDENIELTPTPLQLEAEVRELDDSPQLFILEDVTGAGKTEAAILLLHRLMLKKLGNGVYFSLPTMATSNGMYRRMRKVYRKLYKLESRPSCVLAHSARELSDEFRNSIVVSSVANEVNYGDGTLSADAHCSSWLADNRKKALLANVGVGTIDQVLLAVLCSRHQSLRLLGVLGKVLIFDEIHSSDAYANALLCSLLKVHATTGGSAILLSATLSKKQRQGFVKSFSQGLNKPVPYLEKTCNEDYPLITQVGKNIFDEKILATRKSVQRTVKINFIHDETKIYKLIQQYSNSGKCVCWIRNTIKDARKAYKQLSGKIQKGKLDLFHARYALQDRLTIENRVLDRFGASSTEEDRAGQVLVATQVVQESLDLDFDILITDLAPSDLIIQRAGRLQRHARDKKGNRISGEDQREDAVLYVYCPEWEENPAENWLKTTMVGTAAVYEVCQLWLTQKRLRKEGYFRMPEDARSLVESVYSDEALESVPDNLQWSVSKVEGDYFALISQGKNNRLEFDDGYKREGNWWDENSTPTRHIEQESMSVYLARWEDEELTPWINEGDFLWARSMVNILANKANAEGEYSQISGELIAKTKEQLPAKGKWAVLLPLVKTINGIWKGFVKDKNNQLVIVYYDESKGLMDAEEVQES